MDQKERMPGDERYQRLLDILAREHECLLRIALMKMDGLTNDQIATQLDVPAWAIKRKLERA